MDEKLKPCPFCGGAAELIILAKAMSNNWVAICNMCGAQGEEAHCEEVAKEVWNRRMEIEPINEIKRFKDYQKGKLMKHDIATWTKAEKISVEEAFRKYNCLYLQNLDKYVLDKDALDHYIELLDDTSTPRIYATEEAQISLDADSVIEDACEDLHEDAAENCDNKSLQLLLDKWCSEQTGTITYYPDYQIGVIYKNSRQ